MSVGEPEAVELTLLMPCLNEAQTIETCVRKGLEALQREGICGEVLVADNGSTDGSPDIAARCGARVVVVREPGYGEALWQGIRSARGRFVIMADADDSYDWLDIARFVERLREGYEFVMGCRLPRGGGRIMPGAMPLLNRYLGNPVLSGIGRALFHCPITDFHCGMRAFDREKVLALDLKTPGMEFATEMVIRATQARLKIIEVPITLHRDGRAGPPHLRPWRDGWRHLRFMLLYSPNWLFWLPGLVLLAMGLLGFALIMPGPLRIAHINLDANTLLFSSLACIVGHQWISFALAARALGERDGLLAPDRAVRRLQGIFSLERGIAVGGLLLGAGLYMLGVSLRYWASLHFGDIPYATGLRMVIPSVTLLALGAQFIMSSFFISLTLLRPYRPAGLPAEAAGEPPSQGASDGCVEHETPALAAGRGPLALTPWRHVARRLIAFPTPIVALYVAAFVRQYLWWVQSGSLAWGATGILTLVCMAVWVRSRPADEAPLPVAFWVIVGAPLGILYALRATSPDGSFDVLAYHLFVSERGLNGFPFVGGDFFPGYPFVNPLPDMILGIGRHVLGYRMGTLVNFAALLWTGSALFRLLRDSIMRVSLRCVAVLLILTVETMLFESNTYMVDLIALPLLFEGLCLVSRQDAQRPFARRDLIGVSLLLGAAVAIKLTSLCAALPLGLFAFYRYTRNPSSARERFGAVVGALVAFAVPLAPYALFTWGATSNPLFPYHNEVFRSPYWTLDSPYDGRFGPQSRWAGLLWPVISLAMPERLWEPALCSGRIVLGVVGCLMGLLFVRSHPRWRTWCALYLACAVLWSFAVGGNLRYAMFLEGLAGLIVVAVVAHLWENSSLHASAPRRVVAVALGVALVAQCALGLSYLFRYDLSAQPTLLSGFSGVQANARFLLHDRDLSAFLPLDVKTRFERVDVWVHTCPLTSMLMVMVKPDTPVIETLSESLLSTPEARTRYERTLADIEGKNVYTLCTPDRLSETRALLARRGFDVLESVGVNIPYYSSQGGFYVLMLRLARSAPR